jgi:hypothetical protein
MLRVRFVHDGEGGFRVAHPHVGKEQRRGIHWLALAQPYQLLQRVSVSNSSSRRHWELDQVPAVREPTHIV